MQAASTTRSDGSPAPADRTLRLFVALELPEPVRRATGAWAASELGQIGSLRPVRVDGLHVTLCFLGSTAGTEVEAIGACCRDACAGRGPLRLSLGGLLALPRRRARAVAVRVDDEGHGQLAELQRGLAEALAAGGWYRPEPRPFLAHVTIARVRSGARLDARALDARAPEARAPDARAPEARAPDARARPGVTSLAGALPGAFTADGVTLFESRTQPGGAVYQPRARIELAA
jgi:RNA 2',3'-cyclic 3'-phosphodiesterase